MSELSVVAIVTGVVILALSLPLVLLPAHAGQWIIRFPRSVWPARILTAAGLGWATWLLVDAGPWDFKPFVQWLMTTFGFLQLLLQPLLQVEDFKPILWVLSPAAILLAVFFVDELLAPRALGGLLLLAAAPVLDAARWHGSPWRFVLTVGAYLWVIAGIVLVVSPFRFRKTTAPWAGSSAGCRKVGTGGAVLGVFVVLLGLFVY
jgi:hypothetical protein